MQQLLQDKTSFTTIVNDVKERMKQEKINYRKELVKMLKYLRKVLRGQLHDYNGPLHRRTFKSTYLCSNGQDAEAIYLRDSLTVGELKKFLKDIPDDLTVDVYPENYDDDADTVLRFEYERKQDDQQYYYTIKQWYESELAKEKAKILPVPTEEEYHEMLAKIKRYTDAKSNFGSC